MRTKLYVLGVVLGGAGLAVTGASARVAPPGTVDAGTPEAAPDAGVRTRTTGAPRHPCELITVVAVPCDASKATCEYTYWECPEAPHLLRV
jgi:hypothetical protein